MVNGQGSVGWAEVGKGSQRNHVAIGGVDINILQNVGALLKFGRHFHDHVVLIQRLIDGGHLALSEGVVKHGIDVGCGHAQS